MQAPLHAHVALTYCRIQAHMPLCSLQPISHRPLSMLLKIVPEQLSVLVRGLCCCYTWFLMIQVCVQEACSEPIRKLRYQVIRLAQWIQMQWRA